METVSQPRYIAWHVNSDLEPFLVSSEELFEVLKKISDPYMWAMLMEDTTFTRNPALLEAFEWLKQGNCVRVLNTIYAQEGVIIPSVVDFHLKCAKYMRLKKETLQIQDAIFPRLRALKIRNTLDA